MTYKGNVALWNGRAERQQARDAALEAERQAGEAALAHFRELEAQATALATPPVRRHKPAVPEVKPAIVPEPIEVPAEPVTAEQE
jgi:hypothetical protein